MRKHSLASRALSNPRVLVAGRFLTEPQYIQEFSRRTGFNLDKSNLQIVIGTEVIQGKPGPPTVLAATSW